MRLKILTFATILISLNTCPALGSNSRLDVQCRPETAQDEKLFQTDFGWKYLVTDIPRIFEQVYNWSKRLPLRAYFDSETRQFRLPYYPERGGDIVMPEVFIKNVQLHIENALEKNYVDAVMFPDMGHSHFYIPQESWDKIYDQATSSTDKYSRFYERLFADNKIKTLYHTSEQIKMLDDDKEPLRDRRTIWRFATRNLFAWNDSSGRLDILQNLSSPGGANTVYEVAGYRSWSAGYNISANKDGCFSYTHRGQTQYFDISMYDLAPPSRIIDQIQNTNQ